MYVCQLCGYVYNETAEGVGFAELDAEYRCPLCFAGKKSFKGTE